jgi:hypothetical protein
MVGENGVRHLFSPPFLPPSGKSKIADLEFRRQIPNGRRHEEGCQRRPSGELQIADSRFKRRLHAEGPAHYIDLTGDYSMTNLRGACGS